MRGSRWTLIIAMFVVFLPGHSPAQVPEGYPAGYKDA